MKSFETNLVDALLILKDVVENPEVPASIRVRAAGVILELGWGQGSGRQIPMVG